MPNHLACLVRKLRCRWRALLGSDIVVPVGLSVATEFHGSTCGGWSILADSLTPASIVYSFGIGEDATFDVAVMAKYGCPVFAFDPTPRSVDWVRREVTSPLFRFEATALADHDGVLELYFPSNPDFVSTSLEKSSAMSGASFSAPCASLGSIMARLGHPSVEVLKMDIEGAEYSVLMQALHSGALRHVRQLLVEFHHWMPPFTLRHTRTALDHLAGAGFRVAWVSPGGHEILFVQTAAIHSS